MLEEFGSELDNTDSKLDSTMKKMAKVLHLSNGKYFSMTYDFNNYLTTNFIEYTAYYKVS